MNYYERHLGDYARDAGHLTMLEHGAYTLLLDRYYTTEHGIPVDQAHRICRARTRDEKDAVDSVVAEFFTLSDGVLTNSRAEREIAEYHESAPDREAKKAHARERQRRTRERRKQLFDALRCHGIVPEYDTSTHDLQSMLSRATSLNVTHNVTQPVTRDATATHTPDTTTHTPEEKTKTPRKRSAPAVLVSVDDMVAEGVDRQSATDWLVNRKAKGLPLTPTAWSETKVEAEKAGMLLPTAIKTAAGNGWGGFKAKWLTTPDSRNGHPADPDPFSGAH